jgi:hypothetical protein
MTSAARYRITGEPGEQSAAASQGMVGWQAISCAVPSFPEMANDGAACNAVVM